MASVFKRKGRDCWDFRYKDAQGKTRQSTGWPDKKRTKEHALAVEAECRAIRKGEKDAPPDLAKRNASIAHVVEEYLTWGETQGGKRGRPWAYGHRTTKATNLAFWIDNLGLETLSDIDLPRVEKTIRDLLLAKSAKTASHRVTDLKALIHWAIRRGYTRVDPLVGMASLDDRPKVPHRALTSEEVQALLNTAPVERRLWYEVGLATGFRVNELRSLKVRDLDVFGPSLFLVSDNSKDRKDCRQPIPKEIAEKLRPLAIGRDMDAELLGIPLPNLRQGSSAIIAKDYRAAGVAILTSEGKATWHSLRKCFVNAVNRSGSDPKTTMTLARHSSSQLTFDVYASNDKELLRQGVEAAFDSIKNATSKGTGGARNVAQGSGNPISTDGQIG